MVIDATTMDYCELNRAIRQSDGCTVTGCMGQRFIASGMNDREIIIEGIPGNALGAYLAGAEITVKDNAQDAVGDTMNAGRITICGNVGDAVGYAMRGGEIYIKGNAGYRAGIHMKEYKEKKPVLVIGGRAGSFFGEYQAGGLLIVLGLGIGDKPILGNFPCTGMHGGKVFLRGDADGIVFPPNVSKRAATEQDMEEILPYLTTYCQSFGYDLSQIAGEPFTVITPDTGNPYKQMYVAN